MTCLYFVMFLLKGELHKTSHLNKQRNMKHKGTALSHRGGRNVEKIVQMLR